MISGPRFRVLVRCASVLLLLLAAAGAVRADPPARVGRLNAIEGTVSFAPAGDNEWTEAQANRPLTRGDRLWTDRATRAELQVGSAAIRLDGQTRVEIQALDDDSTQVSVTQGSVYLRVRSLSEGENFEVDTPNLAYRAGYPGDYRIDVDPVQGTTRVTIHSGTGVVYGEAGQTQSLGGGQQVTFRGRGLVQLAVQESPPQDAFDRWAGERNRREDQSIAARYVPREVVGYQQLDPYGQWRRHAAYGAIWFPQGMPAKWAPYRQGHWEWVAPWGWTWIDDAPWGFAPFHYGRWALVDGQWAWAPGRLSVRPVYAPALVAFVGGSASEIAWFPLAPGEAWQPPYAASPLYVSSVNRNLPVAAPATYAYQRQSDALTTIALAQFQRGRPSAGGWWRVAANVLTSAPIVPPPSLPDTALAKARDMKVARKMPQASPPPSAPPVQQVAVQSTPTPPPPQPSAPPAAPAASAPATRAAPRVAAPTPAPAPAPSNTPAAAAVAARAKPATVAATPQQQQPQARSAQARPAREPARAAAREPARIAVPQRVAQAPKAAAPAPAHARAAAVRQAAASRAREQQIARVENARREQAARAEHAHRLQLAREEQAHKARRQAQARHDEQMRVQRQAQARRDEQLRREARLRADDQLRRDMHASHVEQARRVADRDARALREQRLQREEQVRRLVQERDAQARSEAAAAREQQAISDRSRRDTRQRGRPDLRQDLPARQPEVWQRGIPIINYGPTS